MSEAHFTNLLEEGADSPFPNPSPQSLALKEEGWKSLSPEGTPDGKYTLLVSAHNDQLTVSVRPDSADAAKELAKRMGKSEAGTPVVVERGTATELLEGQQTHDQIMDALQNATGVAQLGGERRNNVIAEIKDRLNIDFGERGTLIEIKKLLASRQAAEAGQSGDKKSTSGVYRKT